jgi:hypothetical protein
VPLQHPRQPIQLGVGLGHRVLEPADRFHVPRAGNDVLALGVEQVLAVQQPLAGGGSRVNATPVPESSPMFPKTMVTTLTAVPMLSGMSCSFR